VDQGRIPFHAALAAKSGFRTKGRPALTQNSNPVLNRTAAPRPECEAASQVPSFCLPISAALPIQRASHQVREY
jgi:hypothetical protein